MTLPKFPVDALPEDLRAWVEAEAHATQTPPDLAALGALSVLSSQIARRVVVEARTGYVEPTNIMTAVALDPGNRKSIVFRNATKPLREIERELIEEAKPVVAKLKSRRRQSEGRLKKLEQLAAGDDEDARRDADDLAENLANEVEPALPLLVVEDVTPEKLAMILAEQGGRIFSASPEGNVFDLMGGRYSKANQVDFDIYLRGHAGDDHTVHRVSREAIHIERATITAFYTVQPEVLKAIVGNSAFRGRGLLARFCFAVPESPLGRRIIGAQPVSDVTVAIYRALVRNIGDFDGNRVLKLKEDAYSAFMNWEREIESMLADGGELEYIRDFGGKLAGTTLRLAAILNCAERSVDLPITLGSIERAIKIARYLIQHAKYVLCGMGGFGGQTDHEKLVEWIKARGGVVTLRDVCRGLKEYRNAGDAERALMELAAQGLGNIEVVNTATNMKRVFKLWDKSLVRDLSFVPSCATATTATHSPIPAETCESVGVATSHGEPRGVA